MITQKMIDRINELYHKRVSAGLTPEEEVEQAALRKEYLAGIRAQVKQQLEGMADAGDSHEHAHDDACDCGHCHKH